jgi:hypothetical protein
MKNFTIFQWKTTSTMMMMMPSFAIVVLVFILTFELVQFGEAMGAKQSTAAGHSNQKSHAGNYNITSDQALLISAARPTVGYRLISLCVTHKYNLTQVFDASCTFTELSRLIF